MANNTIMTAKSTFGDGLLMDFAPDNTQATCLTHALNATLVTMNGNELSLQNDMGNGRVETAYLPEGYVPVGTCEFGGIIYIVSYNPIINKSQIGCFPSPERNISSEEMGDTPQNLTDEDFLKDGNVINNSVKKVLCSKDLNPGDKFIVYSTTPLENNAQIITDYGNTSETLYSFPKYLRIHLVAIESSGKINYLDSNLKWYGTGDSHYYISSGDKGIDNGDVDSCRSLLNSGYSVFQSKVSGKLAILAELERIDGFSCTYDVYKINKDNTIGPEGTYTNTYQIFLNCNWHTNNNDINPSNLKVSDIDWVSNRNKEFAGTYQILSASKKDGERSEVLDIDKSDKLIDITYPNSDKYSYHQNLISYKEFLECNFESFIVGKSLEKVSYARDNGIPRPGLYYLDLTTIYKGEYYNSSNKEIKEPEKISDIIINNFYKSSFYKEFMTVDIPDIQVLNVDGELVQYPIDKQDLILKYVVTPKMEYGFLPDLATTSYIDFSKIGTGTINLKTYKYYIGENLCTLSLGTEIYPEENKGVEEILLEFYDNQGLCATYHINDRASYSGNIIEYIPLNGESSSYKLSSLDDNGNLIYHAGLEDADGSVVIDSGGKASKKPDEYKGIVYQNDSGIIYSNMLYAVQIVIKYKSKNILGQFDSSDTLSYKRYWRWMWTNTLFNDYYFTVNDFDENEIQLDLDISVDYKPEYKSDFLSTDYQENTDQSNLYKGLGSKIEHLSGAVKYKVNLGLQNTYNTFNLEGTSTSGAVTEAALRISIGNSYFTQNSQIVYTNNNLLSDDGLLTLLLDNKYSELISNYQNILTNKTYIKIYDTNGVQYYNPIGNMTMTGSTNQEVQYISSKTGQVITNQCPTIETKLQNCYGDFKQSFQLDLWNPSNYLYLFTSQQRDLVIIDNLLSQYESLGLKYLEGSKHTDGSKEINFDFDNVLCLWANDSGHHGDDKKRYVIKLSPDKTIQDTLDALGDLDYFDSDGRAKSDEIGKLIAGVSGYYIINDRGSSNHSQFKAGNQSYFLRDGKSVTKNDTFALSSFADGFFLNFIPMSKKQFSITGGSYTSTSFQLGFKDDSGLHLLNYFDPIHYFSDKVKFYSQNIANFVAAWLAQTFTTSSITQTATVSDLYDLLYNKGDISYTQDIIYEASLKESNLVTLQGVKYKDYLQKVLNNSGSKNKTSNNIKINFNSIQKNIPIQISLNYVSPNIPKQATYKVNAYENTSLWDCSQVIQGKLYQLTDYKLIPIGNNQQIKLIGSSSIDTNNQFNINWAGFRSVTMSNVFNYTDNQLVAKRSSPQTGLYSLYVDNGSWGSGSIVDLLKADTIVPINSINQVI